MVRFLGFLPVFALAAGPALAQDTPLVATGSENVIVALLVTIVLGAIVGWLAGLIVKGSGSGLLLDVLFGIGGAFLAGWLLPRLGIGFGGLVGSFIAALIGAVILIALFRMLSRAT